MEASPKSRWLKCISSHGAIRGVALEATGLVQLIANRHNLANAAIQRLGETVMGGLLISSYCKDRERVNLNVRGSGKIKQALVDAYPDGTVRGYVVERTSDEIPAGGEVVGQGWGFALEPDQKGPWGEGLLSVLRTKNQEREQPFIGTVPLVTGHLAKDLTFYWLQSEQIPSAVGLAVNLADDGSVSSAGGFLVQAMPGASASDVRAIETHIQEIQSLAHRIRQDGDPLHLLSQIFQSTAFNLLEERPLSFRCDCSWERVRRALVLVGVTELRSMLEEDKGASVRCDFCATEYVVAAEDLRQMIQDAS